MANKKLPQTLPLGPPQNLRPAGAHKQKKEESRSLVKRKLAALLAEIAEGP